jgi:hypothetical protein
MISMVKDEKGDVGFEIEEEVIRLKEEELDVKT